MKRPAKNRVLWADDQVDVAQTLGKDLEEAGVDFSYCADGARALSLLRVEYYDAVILDLRMPPGEWGGIAVLEAMKTEGLKIPVNRTVGRRHAN